MSLPDLLLTWLNQGVTGASVAQLVIYTLVVTHMTIVAVTLYLHRHSAHRALELHPAARHFFRFWLWLTTGMLTKEWTAIHRKHHATCETEDDPHSPQVQGLKKIFWQGAEVYRDAATAETLQRYGSGTPDDWIERKLYTPGKFLGVALMLVLDLVLFGVIGMTIWAIQMLWIPVLAAGVINGVGHFWGYRNFECPDAATNIFPWGILVGGEELHNNHHTYPNSAKFSVKAWEFDMGWLWIRLLALFGLAKPRSTGPVTSRVDGKSTLDLDTAWALLNDRFRVMASYAENVVRPLVTAESAEAGEGERALFKKAKHALCRHESLIDDDARQQINALLDHSPALKKIYDMRVALHSVWAHRGADAERMLAELKAWCVAAEESGIASLREFVAELKSYSIPRAASA